MQHTKNFTNLEKNGRNNKLLIAWVDRTTYAKYGVWCIRTKFRNLKNYLRFIMFNPMSYLACLAT